MVDTEKKINSYKQCDLFISSLVKEQLFNERKKPTVYQIGIGRYIRFEYLIGNKKVVTNGANRSNRDPRLTVTQRFPMGQQHGKNR